MLQNKLVACCRVGLSEGGTVRDYDARAAGACAASREPAAASDKISTPRGA
jgi:hypothetical protein